MSGGAGRRLCLQLQVVLVLVYQDRCRCGLDEKGGDESEEIGNLFSGSCQ